MWFLSRLIGGNKTIPSCCILPARTCKPGRSDDKNAITSLSHWNNTYTYLQITCHHSSCYNTYSTHNCAQFTLSLNTTASITPMSTCVSLCISPSYKQQFFLQTRYVHNTGNFSIHCEWMEFLILFKTLQTLTTHHCIYYTQKYNLTLQNFNFTLHFTLLWQKQHTLYPPHYHTELWCKYNK